MTGRDRRRPEPQPEGGLRNKIDLPKDCDGKDGFSNKVIFEASDDTCDGLLVGVCDLGSERWTDWMDEDALGSDHLPAEL